MNDIQGRIAELLATTEAHAVLRATFTVLIGIGFAAVVRRWLRRVKMASHSAALVTRVLVFVIIGTTLASALAQLGIDLSVLMGAAGILTVALGFASQTSASNAVSGLFLMGERPFVAGDVIRVGDTTGEVLAIDFMSTKLKTFDNLLIRVPNETVLKSVVVNLTRFPIRRFDMKIAVALTEDLGRVRATLLDAARANALSLADPEPLFLVLGYGASSIDIQFSVWCAKESFTAVTNSMYEGVQAAFATAGIRIPVPAFVLRGPGTGPLDRP